MVDENMTFSKALFMLDLRAGADEGHQEFYLQLFFAQKLCGPLAKGIACRPALTVCDPCKPDALFLLLYLRAKIVCQLQAEHSRKAVVF